jgi:hypothetical protein
MEKNMDLAMNGSGIRSVTKELGSITHPTGLVFSNRLKAQKKGQRVLTME